MKNCHLIISFKAVLPALCVQWLHLFAVKLVKVKVIKYSLLRIRLRNFFIRVLTVSVLGTCKILLSGFFSAKGVP